MDDKVAKGLSISGEDHKMAKLSSSEVKEIFGLLGTTSHPVIARRFGVDPSAISKIKRGISWSSVTGIPNKRRTALKAASTEETRDVHK